MCARVYVCTKVSLSYQPSTAMLLCGWGKLGIISGDFAITSYDDSVSVKVTVEIDEHKMKSLKSHKGGILSTLCLCSPQSFTEIVPFKVSKL